MPPLVSRRTSSGDGGAPLLSQVMVKALPPVSAEGVASVTSLAGTMVRLPKISPSPRYTSETCESSG
jgi:hypothetical protein